jgi:hypothetical protein
MTEWFPKKINPVRAGNYMVKTAGKNSYTYQCKWTGEKWTSSWSDDEVKIKEWQGLAQDPDADVATINTAFDEFNFEQTVTEIEQMVAELEKQINDPAIIDSKCVRCDWKGDVNDTWNNQRNEMVCPMCGELVETDDQLNGKQEK